MISLDGSVAGSLEGVRRLTLEVDMADKLFVCDRADWLRVRLVR